MDGWVGGYVHGWMNRIGGWVGGWMNGAAEWNPYCGMTEVKL